MTSSGGTPGTVKLLLTNSAPCLFPQPRHRHRREEAIHDVVVAERLVPKARAGELQVGQLREVRAQ
jgi:hypothetical protein